MYIVFIYSLYYIVFIQYVYRVYILFIYYLYIIYQFDIFLECFGGVYSQMLTFYSLTMAKWTLQYLFSNFSNLVKITKSSMQDVTIDY